MTSTSTPPAAARHQAGLAGGLLGALVASWAGSSLGGMVPQLADAYGVGIAAVGLLVTLSYAGNLIAQIPVGMLIDRVGAHRTAMLGAGAILLANVAAAAADVYALAAAARVLVGLGIAGLFLGGIEYVRVTRESPVVQGFFGTFNGLGVVTLAAVPFLSGWLSWRAPFVSTAVLAAACLLLLLLAPGTPRPERSQTGPRALAQVLRDRAIYRIGVVVLLPVPLSFVASAWTATLLIQRHDASATLAGAIAALVVVAGVLTRPLGGVVARRSRRSIGRSLALTMSLGGIATAVVTLAPNLAVAAPAAAVMGLASGIPFPLGFGAAARLHPEAPGQSVALANMLVVLTLVVGIAVIGLAFSPLGDGRIGFLAMAAAWVAPLPLLPATLRQLERRAAL